MYLQAKIPGIDFYKGLLFLQRMSSDDEALIIQGKDNFWNSEDCLVVSKGDYFSVLRNVAVSIPGTFFHYRIKSIIKFLEEKNFNSKELCINIHGVFDSDMVDFRQIPLDFEDDRSFSPCESQGFEHLEEAKKSILRDKINEISGFNQDNPPKMTAALVKKWERDAILCDLLKEYRGAKCQICDYFFIKKDGEPYVEVHHLEQLSNGGLNICSNLLVLCANCHRAFHYADVRVESHTENELNVIINNQRYCCKL